MMGGAKALGLDHRIGSLTPGKQADILLYDTRSITMAGWNLTQPEAAILLQCTAHDLDSVLVAGKFVKRHRQLAYNEIAACTLLDAANQRLRADIERNGGLANALEKQITRFSADSSDAVTKIISY